VPSQYGREGGDGPSRCSPLEASALVCGRVARPGGKRPRLAVRAGGVDAECEVAHLRGEGRGVSD
jgi:hypothetical protein